MSITETPTADNGVNVEALLQARDAMTDAPEAAAFKWQATNQWVTGAHSRTTIEQFFGVGAGQSHVKAFTYDADHPEVFAATDNAPTPVEFVLHALAACLTAGVASVAQNRGIQLTAVTSKLEGDMDLAGILGIDRDTRNGYSQIRVSFEVEGDATDEELRAVVAQSAKRSAVYDVISNPVDVVIEVNA